jgi:hypothetical protein
LKSKLKSIEDSNFKPTLQNEKTIGIKQENTTIHTTNTATSVSTNLRKGRIKSVSYEDMPDFQKDVKLNTIPHEESYTMSYVELLSTMNAQHRTIIQKGIQNLLATSRLIDRKVIEDLTSRIEELEVTISIQPQLQSSAVLISQRKDSIAQATPPVRLDEDLRHAKLDSSKWNAWSPFWGFVIGAVVAALCSAFVFWKAKCQL